MATGLTAFAVFATGCTTMPVADAAAREGDEMDRWIAQRAQVLQLREFPHTRIVAAGDLGSDGKRFDVVVFRLDGTRGGDSFQQFLLVHQVGKRGGFMERRVGASGGKSITQVRVVGDRIELLASEYLASDAACCPTGWKWLAFRIAENSLVELGSVDPTPQPSER